MADGVAIDCETGEQTPTPPPEPNPEADTAQAWAMFRHDRDARLVASDWTQLADTGVANEADRQAWAAYRQELRDLTETTSDPANPDWPDAPDAPVV